MNVKHLRKGDQSAERERERKKTREPYKLYYLCTLYVIVVCDGSETGHLRHFLWIHLDLALWDLLLSRLSTHVAYSAHKKTTLKPHKYE